MAAAQVKIDAYIAEQGGILDENSVTLATNAEAIAEGKEIFNTNCAACHKTDGGGLIGPNLTDEYWIHGGDIKDLFVTIKYGIFKRVIRIFFLISRKSYCIFCKFISIRFRNSNFEIDNFNLACLFEIFHFVNVYNQICIF